MTTAPKQPEMPQNPGDEWETKLDQVQKQVGQAPLYCQVYRLVPKPGGMGKTMETAAEMEVELFNRFEFGREYGPGEYIVHVRARGIKGILANYAFTAGARQIAGTTPTTTEATMPPPARAFYGHQQQQPQQPAPSQQDYLLKLLLDQTAENQKQMLAMATKAMEGRKDLEGFTPKEVLELASRRTPAADMAEMLEFAQTVTGAAPAAGGGAVSEWAEIIKGIAMVIPHLAPMVVGLVREIKRPGAQPQRQAPRPPTPPARPPAPQLKLAGTDSPEVNQAPAAPEQLQEEAPPELQQEATPEIPAEAGLAGIEAMIPPEMLAMINVLKAAAKNDQADPASYAEVVSDMLDDAGKLNDLLDSPKGTFTDTLLLVAPDLAGRREWIDQVENAIRELYPAEAEAPTT